MLVLDRVPDIRMEIVLVLTKVCYTNLNPDEEMLLIQGSFALGVTTLETFQSTLNKCFATVVEDILGRTVRAEIFSLLERNGIHPSEVASRFDGVIEVLTSAFGDGARVLVFKTVMELYKEYSQRAGFSFGESLRDQVTLLRERVASDLLRPRDPPSIDDSIHNTSGAPRK